MSEPAITFNSCFYQSVCLKIFFLLVFFLGKRQGRKPNCKGYHSHERTVAKWMLVKSRCQLTAFFVALWIARMFSFHWPFNLIWFYFFFLFLIFAFFLFALFQRLGKSLSKFSVIWVFFNQLEILLINQILRKHSCNSAYVVSFSVIKESVKILSTGPFAYSY